MSAFSGLASQGFDLRSISPIESVEYSIASQLSVLRTSGGASLLLYVCVHVLSRLGKEYPLKGVFVPSGAFLIKSFALNYKYPRTHYICRALIFVF